MAQNLPSGNTLLGYYLCQGKMPHSVRARYEAMAQADPQKAQPMLDNFDRALAHPNGEDLDGLETVSYTHLDVYKRQFYTGKKGK